MFQAGSCFDWNVLQASLRPINNVLGLVRLDKAEGNAAAKILISMIHQPKDD